MFAEIIREIHAFMCEICVWY